MQEQYPIKTSLFMTEREQTPIPLEEYQIYYSHLVVPLSD
jgi:hypothetical protein